MQGLRAIYTIWLREFKAFIRERGRIIGMADRERHYRVGVPAAPGRGSHLGARHDGPSGGEAGGDTEGRGRGAQARALRRHRCRSFRQARENCHH